MVFNDLDYFETQGVNVLVYSNLFTGGFNDEKTAGLELIHHGVRTLQGGAVRLNNTPEQWDLVPSIPTRTVDHASNTIESVLRYEDYNFESRVVVTAKGKGVEISVYLDEPVPAELEGHAGFNLEFLPSQYWGKVYLMDGRLNRFPRYAVGNSITRPNSEKMRQYKGYVTYDDRGTDRFVDPLPLETGRATRPKEVFYVNNRADFSFIPGNVAPGILFRQPDHFENYDDWPFIWGQNEGTISGNTSYLFFGKAFKNLIK